MGFGAPPARAVRGNEACVPKLHHGTHPSSLQAVSWWRSHLYHLWTERGRISPLVFPKCTTSASHCVCCRRTAHNCFTAAITWVCETGNSSRIHGRRCEEGCWRKQAAVERQHFAATQSRLSWASDNGNVRGKVWKNAWLHTDYYYNAANYWLKIK